MSGAVCAGADARAGLNTPDNRLDVGGTEATKAAEEIGAVLEANADANATIR
ncbi:MAG: beta-galactosidase (EC [uncultured Paraburkholderia sp.]|nr:MAG: beta-galactosidase (EC [uncultured Paraburkholderia sp.]CAH2924387.1 MAG: beta-galactosidase (EC [uncultured Paraburkholderia sp.]